MIDLIVAGQEVEDACSPSQRRHRQAERRRLRRPPGRLSVVGSPRLTPPGQPGHAGMLHLQWSLHKLHPGGYLAATPTHTGKFVVSAANYITGSKHSFITVISGSQSRGLPGVLDEGVQGISREIMNCQHLFITSC